MESLTVKEVYLYIREAGRKAHTMVTELSIMTTTRVNTLWRIFLRTYLRWVTIGVSSRGDLVMAKDLELESFY